MTHYINNIGLVSNLQVVYEFILIGEVLHKDKVIEANHLALLVVLLVVFADDRRLPSQVDHGRRL